MIKFNKNKLMFETSGKTIKIKAKFKKKSSKNGSEDDFSSIHTITKELNLVEKVSYKIDLYKAIYTILMKNIDDEIICFSHDMLDSKFSMNFDKEYLSLSEISDIGKLYKLGSINSLNLSTDTAEINFLFYVILKSKEVINKISFDEKNRPNFTLFEQIKDIKYKKDILTFCIKYLINLLLKKRIDNNLKYLLTKLKSNLTRAINIQNIINDELSSMKNHNDTKYYKILKTLSDIIDNYNNNYLPFIDKTSNNKNNLVHKLKSSSAKSFIYLINNLEKPVIAIKQNERYSLICSNYLKDNRLNKTNIKLREVSQNSDFLFIIEMLFGFLFTIVEGGIKVATALLEHEIACIDRETALINRNIATNNRDNLLNLLNDKFNSDEISHAEKEQLIKEMNEYIDRYIEILNDTQLFEKFDHNIPYTQDMIQSIRDTALDTLKLSKIEFAGITKLEIYI